MCMLPLLGTHLLQSQKKFRKRIRNWTPFVARFFPLKKRSSFCWLPIIRREYIRLYLTIPLYSTFLNENKHAYLCTRKDFLLLCFSRTGTWSMNIWTALRLFNSVSTSSATFDKSLKNFTDTLSNSYNICSYCKSFLLTKY